MSRPLRWLWLALLLPALAGCAGLSELQRDQAVQIAAQARDVAVECDRPETACARPSPLRALAVQAWAQSSPDRKSTRLNSSHTRCCCWTSARTLWPRAWT